MIFTITVTPEAANETLLLLQGTLGVKVKAVTSHGKGLLIVFRAPATNEDLAANFLVLLESELDGRTGVLSY